MGVAVEGECQMSSDPKTSRLLGSLNINVGQPVEPAAPAAPKQRAKKAAAPATEAPTTAPKTQRKKAAAPAAPTGGVDEVTLQQSRRQAFADELNFHLQNRLGGNKSTLRLRAGITDNKHLDRILAAHEKTSPTLDYIHKLAEGLGGRYEGRFVFDEEQDK